MLKSGAFDSLDPNRAGLMTALPEAMKSAEQMLRDIDRGQVDLFGSAQVPAERRANGKAHKPWDEAERLAAEKEALGLYLTGHPVSRYAEELRAMCGRQISDLSLDDAGASGWRQEESTTRIAGLVASLRLRNGNSGKNAFLNLDDRSGRIEVAVFADDLRKHSELINKDQILVIEGGLSFDEFAGALRLRARKLMDLDQARAQYAKRLEIILSAPAGEPGTSVALEKLLGAFRGGSCPISLIYRSPEREVRLQFGEEWRIRPCEELLLKLHEIPGIQNAELRYR